MEKIAGGAEGRYSLNFILPAHYIYVDKTTTSKTSMVLFYNKAKNKSHKINKKEKLRWRGEGETTIEGVDTWNEEFLLNF